MLTNVRPARASIAAHLELRARLSEFETFFEIGPQFIEDWNRSLWLALLLRFGTGDHHETAIPVAIAPAKSEVLAQTSQPSESAQGHEQSPTSIRTLGITCSMSRTGNCSVNAVAKRFCWSLKYEWANHRVSAEFESARQSVFNDLEIFYNERRRHQTRAWVSPGEFETDFHNRSSKAVETAQP